MKMRKFGLVVTCLFCFVLVGLLELVGADFSMDKLQDPMYWYKVFATTFANAIILFMVADDGILDSYTKNDKIVTNEQEVEKLVKTEIFPDFEQAYLPYKNKKRKIIAWKEHLQKDISKLDKKAKQEDIELFWYGTKEQKEKNKYCTKRAFLMHKMSDEYIDKNIMYLDVKYDKLYGYEIKTGSKQSSENYTITTNREARIVKDNYKKFLWSVAIILMTSSLIPEDKQFTWLVLFLFVSKVITLCYNAYVGRVYAQTYQTDVIIPDLSFRKDTIIDYVNWKINNKKESDNNGNSTTSSSSNS